MIASEAEAAIDWDALYDAAVVKLGMAPSEFWAMTLPETVAMMNMHTRGRAATGKPKLSDDWVREELAWLRGEDAAGN